MEAKFNIKTWFESEVMWPRTTSSLIRAVFLQFTTLFVFIALQSFNPLHPLTWISTSIGLLITPTSWFYDLIAIATVTGIGLFYSSQVSLFPWIPKNHLANFTRCFLPQVLLSFVAHFAAGGVLMRSYLGLLDGKFNSLTVVMAGEKGLNAPHVWLVMSGCFTALTMWKGFHFSNENLVQFPMIAQTGNAQLSRQVSGLIKASFNNVVVNFKWFLLLYVIFGHRFLNILSELSRLEPHYLITTSMWNCVELTLNYLVLNSLLSFSLKLLRSIICINFTKRFNFDVTGNSSMIQAMSVADHDLMAHSAFYEFSLVASDSKAKRSEFYTLSQPGGHPHNWNNLSSACLNKIENFVKKLNDSVAAPAPVAPIAPKPAAKPPVLYSDITSPKSPRPLVAPQLKEKIISENNNKIQNVKINEAGVQKRIEELLSKSALASYPVKLLKAIRDRFSNNALFSSAPDAGTRSVFAESQIIIWAVEGLSYLISSSMQEDRYGVVQKDLPRVISCLFVLQKTVDKHKGVTISSKKNRLETRDLQLKQELRAVLKSSIYRKILENFYFSKLNIPNHYPEQKI